MQHGIHTFIKIHEMLFPDFFDIGELLCHPLAPQWMAAWKVSSLVHDEGDVAR